MRKLSSPSVEVSGSMSMIGPYTKTVCCAIENSVYCGRHQTGVTVTPGHCMEEVALINKLLTLEETAELLRKTPAALRYQVHRGTAPRSAKILGRRMFRESDVVAFIDAQFQAEEEKVSA